MTDCALKRVEAQYNYAQSQADLRAQQEVAIWTGGVFALGLIGYFVSIVGIGFLYANLRMLQQQINNDRDAALEQAGTLNTQIGIATRAAEAAEKTALETRRIGENQSRAYIHVSAADIDYTAPKNALRLLSGADAKDVDRVPFLFLTFENVGQTPPKRVEYAVEVREYIDTLAGRVLFAFDDQDFLYETVPNVYPASPRRIGIFRPKLEEEISAIVDSVAKRPPTQRGSFGYGYLRMAKILVFGRVKYVDVFDNLTFSDFAFWCYEPRRGDLTKLVADTDMANAAYESAKAKK